MPSATLTGNEKQTILDKLGDRVEKMRPLGPRCVVAVYQREGKTAGGIFIPGSMTDADKAQSKVGLLVSVGKNAFVEDDKHDWGGTVPKLGDWVAFRVGDTVQMDCGQGTENSQRIRVIEDVDIIMVLEQPDVVY